MKSLFITASAALILSSCNATKGSGNKITEDRKVGDFSAIILDCPVDLTITVGQENSVSVWADDNLIQMVTTEVSNGTLTIDMEGNYMTSGGLKATVTVPRLDSIENDGSGDIEIANLSSSPFTATVSGSGNIKVNGSTDILEATVSGSGDLDAGLLTCKIARATNSGSGDLKINASKTLEVTLSGSGDVTSIGKAKVTSEVTGSGELK